MKKTCLNPGLLNAPLGIALLLFMLSPLPQADAFRIPETLKYDLTWTGVKAGTSILGIEDSSDTVKITAITRSADWVSVFYTVDDHIESILEKSVNAAFGLPVNYRIKLREGKHRRDKEVNFNLKNKKALYTDHLENEKKEFDIPGEVLDPMSSLYYLRTLQLEVGKPVYITIFDSKKVWDVEVQVLKKETVELRSGTFKTILVKPLMKSEGIFYKKGDIYLWLTDDEKRIPVKMKTKVAIGSITATLVEGGY